MVRGRPIRRLFAQAGLCLLAGIGLTTAVAWAAMLVPAKTSRGVGAWTAIDRGSALASSQHLGATGTMRIVQRTVNGTAVYETDNWSGWPANSMGYTIRYGDAADVSGPLVPLDRLVPRYGLNREHHLLPLVPLWPGFAIDTGFYAGLSWLVLFVPLAARRRIRRRCDSCTACEYNLAGLETCPECGAAR